MKKDLFLEEARLGPRHPVMIEYDEAPRVPQLRRRFTQYALVDLAHALMLTEQGIFAPDQGRLLLRGLLEIFDLGPGGFPWDPRAGAYVVQVEHYLKGKLGEGVSGLIQTARSRIDQEAAAERLFLRDELLIVIGELVRLQRTVLPLARRHADSVMPGYGFLQHAQPWTFGHYLMRQVSIVDRDLQRLQGAYRRTNQSALGVAAGAGVSWPVNRHRIAELLGHDGIVVNGLDAGCFASDYVEEDLACLAIMMSSLGRFATDLYVWHAWEFSFVEVADNLGGTSSAMPQKKNPESLTRVKALAGQAAGWLPGTMACQRGVLFSDYDLYYGEDPVAPPVDACLASLRILTEVLESLTVRVDVMAEKAGAFWSTASHLADELVRRYGLPWRTAHHVLGRFVRDSIAAGHQPTTASPEVLAAAAKEFANLEVSISAADLRQCLNARHFVESRVSEGSVNPRRVLEHIEHAERAVDSHARWHAEHVARTSQSVTTLLDTVKKVAGR